MAKEHASKENDPQEKIEETGGEIQSIEGDGATTIEERVEQEFSTMLSAYGDANMLQLRSEVGIGGQEKLNKLLEGVGESWETILTLDPNEIAENADQYIKILQLQSATAKRVTQFAGGKDTKEAIVMAEVKPLLRKAQKKG